MDRPRETQNAQYLCRHTYYSELNNRKNVERAAARRRAAAAERPSERRSGGTDELYAGLRARLTDRKRIDGMIYRAAEWLEVDDRTRRVECASRRLPVSVMAAIMAVALSLLMIVAGAVISSKANMELYEAENELNRLKATELELARELELKNDLRYIEEVARGRLGMVEREHASVLTVDSDCEDHVELYEQKGAQNGFSAILDALGFFGE